MSERAPEKRLPKLVEPRKLAVAHAHFQRFIDAEDLPRLQEVALKIESVIVDIQFGKDEQGRPQLSGDIQGSLMLECQRCLEPMLEQINRQVSLAIVWDEAQAKALPKNLDPWIVGEEEADLAAILEEELLLALPVVARHTEDCLGSGQLSFGEPEETEEVKPNPFSVLADLKDKH